MAQNSNDILNQILGVLGKIEKKLNNPPSMGDSGKKESSHENKKTTSKESSTSKKSKAGSIGMISDSIGKDFDEKNSKNLKTMSAVIKELSNSVGELSKGLMKWWRVPKAAKKSLTSFINDLGDSAKLISVGNGRSAKLMAESLEIISKSLVPLAKGVVRFGIASKLGFTKATTAGLLQIYSVMVAIGNPVTAPLVLTAAAAIGAVGLALQGIGSVLSGLGKLMLSFAGSVAIMVGAIWLAGKLFNVGPLAAMGIIVGAIGILSMGFALIGLMGPLIMSGGLAIAQLGKGLLWVSGGILAILGLSLLIKAVLSPGQTLTDVVLDIFKPILLLAGLFAIVGIFGGLIKRGANAIIPMGKGLLWLSGGILALGVVSKLLTIMGVDPNEHFGQIALGVLKLAGMMALLGLGSLLILPGIKVLTGISISLVLLGVTLLAVDAIINKLGGAKGLETASTNISLLVSSVLSGTVSGITKGLLGDNADTSGGLKGFVKNAATMAKNTAILIGGIGLMIGVAFALIMFAFAIKAFTKAGSIKTVTGYDSNGEPIFGETVNVVSAGENIAKSIGSFFTTLTTTFKDPSIIPDKDTINDLIDILMGNQGFRIFGIRVIKNNRPGLIDALGKFAELIAFFAKVDQIPVFDEKGKVKKYTNPTEIAGNIVNTLSSFFAAFKQHEATFANISSDSTAKIGEALLGTKAMSVFGIKFTKDKPGLLEPIIKFAELIQLVGGTPGFINSVDENGKTTKIDMQTSADNIITTLSKFVTAIANSNALSSDAEIEKGAKKIGKFEAIIEKLNSLAVAKDGIESTANAINLLSKSLTNLSDALDKLRDSKEDYKSTINIDHTETRTKEINTVRVKSNEEKLGAKIKEIDAKTEEINKRSENKEKSNTTSTNNLPASTTNIDNLVKELQVSNKNMETLMSMIANQNVGGQVSSAFKNAQFKFDFQNNTGGVLTLNKT